MIAILEIILLVGLFVCLWGVSLWTIALGFVFLFLTSLAGLVVLAIGLALIDRVNRLVKRAAREMSELKQYWPWILAEVIIIASLLILGIYHRNLVIYHHIH